MILLRTHWNTVTRYHKLYGPVAVGAKGPDTSHADRRLPRVAMVAYQSNRTAKVPRRSAARPKPSAMYADFFFAVADIREFQLPGFKKGFFDFLRLGQVAEGRQV